MEIYRNPHHDFQHHQSNLLYAFTFQAHPEYASDYGLNQSFVKVAQKMNSSKLITNECMENATKCATCQYDTIEQDSVNLMVVVGTTLGWF